MHIKVEEENVLLMLKNKVVKIIGSSQTWNLPSDVRTSQNNYTNEIETEVIETILKKSFWIIF